MKSTLLIGNLLAVGAVAALAVSAVQAREPGMPRGERTFERLDKNKSGALEPDELGTRSERRFMRLDADKDDKVTRAEIESWLNRLTARRVGRIMDRMDADNDQAVSRTELQDYISGLFLAADADKSGGVTLQEARDYHVAKRKARAEARKRASATRQ
jgi:hypothetical protein